MIEGMAHKIWKKPVKGRKPNRLPRYDYSQNGYYFVTICAHGRKEWLGKVDKGEIILSSYGAIAAIYWKEIPKHYSNVILDEWVIMPNHIHGIIVISSSAFVGTEQCSVPTDAKSLSVSQIIKSFKDVTIKRVRSEFGDISFAWQRSFYEHVIRNEISLGRIREYIRNNPVLWDVDIENREHRSECVDYYEKLFFE